jgi:hypothetical protein
MICTAFHCAGKYPLSVTALNDWVIFYSNNRQFFKNFTSDEVEPDDFLGFWVLDDFLNFSSFETVDWWFELVWDLQKF